jgi:hypothetical protein
MQKSIDAFKQAPNRLRAAKAVAADHGVSPVTIWRWWRDGRIRIVRIANRPYVDMASLEEFQRAALDGKYETPLAGAAERSAAARVAKESQNKLNGKLKSVA